MVTLLPDTASQFIYLSLGDRVKDFAAFTNYLVEFENQLSNQKYYLIGDPTVDNSRYTKLAISTSLDDATAGDIKIVETGLFNYAIYGQNSTTNLDPTNATVIGTIAKGVLKVLTQKTYYDAQSVDIPSNVIYYQ